MVVTFIKKLTLYTMKRFYNDIELINGLKNADNKAIKYIYYKYRREVQNYIITNQGSINDAEDILHESVIKLFYAVKKDDFSIKTELHLYFRSIYKNTWKRKKMEKNILDKTISFNNELDTFPYESLDNNNADELQLIIISNIKKLNKDCRQILELFYKNGMFLNEIAQKMNYKNEQIVKNKKYRCLNYLKKLLINHPFYKKNF